MSFEAIKRFACFGGTCTVLATSVEGPDVARAVTAQAQTRMLGWHARFSRFLPDSELSRLNADHRTTVPATALMVRLAHTALEAARLTGGLVDPTLAPELRDCGYARSLTGINAPAPLALADALAAAPARAMAGPDPAERWRTITVDLPGRTITRPPGVELDSGGIGKGLFGDVLAARLAGLQSFAIDACGDIRLGGVGTAARPVQIAGPGRSGEILHTFELHHGAVATSSIARRAWRGADGRPAHHLLDPATGRPAHTGLVQVSALAATGVEAEARAKAALLSGPVAAAEWLPDGGVVIDDEGVVQVFAASAALTGASPRLAIDGLSRGAALA
jgi:thiamine biosynthesis lipoprotein